MAPTPADGSVEIDGDGNGLTLVQNAQHDVNGDHRREDEDWLIRERV